MIGRNVHFGDAADHFVELFGRNARAGPFGPDHVRRDGCAAINGLERHDAAMGPGADGSFELMHGLAIAQRLLDAPYRGDELRKFVRLDGHALVRAGLATVENDVFFQQLGAQGGGGHARPDVGRVVRVPHDEMESLFQFTDDAEIHVGVSSRVFGRAVHQDQLIVNRAKRVDGFFDLVKVAHAGGKNDGFAEASDDFQGGQVGHFARADLEGAHAHLVDFLGGFAAERRAKIDDAQLLAIALELVMLIEVQRVTLQKLIERHIEIGGHGHAIPQHLLVRQMVLELDRVGATGFGLANHFLGGFQIAEVIVAGFRDDETRSATANGTTVEGDGLSHKKEVTVGAEMKRVRCDLHRKARDRG